jgi:hypothetical protein
VSDFHIIHFLIFSFMSNAVMVSEENVAGVKHHLSIPLHYTMASASELRGTLQGKLPCVKVVFQSSHEAPRCECLHLIKMNCLAL